MYPAHRRIHEKEITGARGLFGQEETRIILRQSGEYELMAQHEIEIILMRQLASYLAAPVFIVDPVGNLVFYNEPAEEILGQRFEETGEMPVGEWSTVFRPTALDGVPLPPDEVPLVVALRERRPVHREFRLVGLDGTNRHIGATALPLIGQAGRFLGAIAFFWESEPR